MNAATYGLVVLLVVAAVGAYALLPAVAPGSTTSAVTSATTVTTATSCSSSSLGGLTPISLNGTYTPQPSSQVRIDYVKALVYSDPSGPSTLRFEVGLTNVGNSSIYTLIGCGSTLNSTITSGSQVVKSSDGARCLCAEALSPLAQGQSTSEYDPGCWSGYSYQVMQGGMITAKLTLSWYGGNEFNSPSSVQISANFTIP
jgi:hypothetical protein